jgi:DNA-binding CsgD family transcriptional regulator
LLANHKEQRIADALPTLFDKRIASMLLQGQSNLEIAESLDMSERTIKAHLAKMYAVLDIKDGVKRVRLATLLYRAELNRQVTARQTFLGWAREMRAAWPADNDMTPWDQFLMRE